MPVNPNRVTMYMSERDRQRVQRTAERLSAPPNNAEGLLDDDGKVIIKALFNYLLNELDKQQGELTLSRL